MQFSTNSLPRMKTQRHKFGVGSLLFMIVFGAIFGGIGLFLVNTSKIDPTWTHATGSIVSTNTNTSSDSTTYTPVIQYEVSGQQYTVVGNHGTSSIPAIGTPREVAYNPGHPEQAKAVSSASIKAFLYIFPAIGGLCVLFAPILFVRSLKRSKVINDLVQSGHKLPGVLVDILSQGSNNSSSYKIVVAATYNGEVKNFESDSLTGVGGLAMADFRNTPIPIDVYVNNSNPDDYYVDISDVPNLTPERIMDLIKTATARQQGGSLTQPTVSPLQETIVKQPPTNSLPPSY